MKKSVQTGVYVYMRFELYKLCDVQMGLLDTISTEPVISTCFPLNASLHWTTSNKIFPLKEIQIRVHGTCIFTYQFVVVFPAVGRS